MLHELHESHTTPMLGVTLVHTMNLMPFNARQCQTRPEKTNSVAYLGRNHSQP